ncbi:MAG: hypothetical protein ACK50Q_04150 [Labrys sp. (in: a-proteobacteria)]|jgi:hypothetical protein
MSTTFLRWAVLLLVLVVLVAGAAWIFPDFREILGVAGFVVLGALVLMNWMTG